MTRKKSTRSAESYVGNTPGAKKRQRSNLVPGNTWAKMQRKELKLDCWWWTLPLTDIQIIYETNVNDRYENIPKEELKSEDFLDNVWWDSLTVEEKEKIVKDVRRAFGGDTEGHKKLQDERLEEEIKLEKLADEKGRTANDIQKVST